MDIWCVLCLFFHLNKLLNKQTSYWWFETPMRLLNKQTSYWWFETPWGCWTNRRVIGDLRRHETHAKSLQWCFCFSSTAGEPVGETRDTLKWHVTRATCAPLPSSPATLRSPPNGQDRSTPTIMTVFPDRWIHGKTVQYLMQWPLIVNLSPPLVRHWYASVNSVLVQVMACRLFDAKPLSEPMLVCCQLEP